MVTKLGTQLGTQLGTDLGSFVDNPVAAAYDPTKTYALTNYSTTGRYSTPAGGGEAGDVAGFGMIILGVVEALPTATQSIAARRTTGQGYATWTDPTAPGYLYATMNDGGGVSIGTRTTTGLTLGSTDVGKIIPLVISHSGSAVGLAGWDGSLKKTTAITGYTPPAGTLPFVLGPQGTAVAYAPFAALTFRGTPTDPQIKAVLAAARTAGGMPTKSTAEALMPGTTVTHRWALRDTLAALNQPVTDGQAAPTTIADSVTGAAGDLLTKTGTPTVKVIDPATPRAWSYETTPIYNGADALTNTAYYSSSFDDPSSSAGFWWAILLYMPAVTQIASVIGGAATTNAGFDIRVGANNTTMNWFIGDGAAFNTSSNAVIQTNKVNLIVGVWDAPNLTQRTYQARAQVGTGSARSGYAPPAAGTKVGIGRTTRDPTSAGGSRAILGYAQGLGVPTLAQIQATYDAVASTDAMQTIAGVTTSVFVDFTAQVSGNGGALPASITNSGTTGGTFARTGSPTVTPVYARAYSW